MYPLWEASGWREVVNMSEEYIENMRGSLLYRYMEKIEDSLKKEDGTLDWDKIKSVEWPIIVTYSDLIKKQGG